MAERKRRPTKPETTIAPERATVMEMVRRLRTAARLSHEKLAELAGLHRNSVRNFEVGESDMKLDNLAAVARALGVPLLALLHSDTTPIADVVKAYQDSPWAQIDKPTDKEIKMLLNGPAVRSFGGSPDPEAIHHAILSIRSSNRE